MLYSEIIESSPYGVPSISGRTASPVIVMHKVAQISNLNAVSFLETNVTTWWFCNRGQFRASYVFERDVVTMYDKLKVNLTCDLTNCKNSASDVKILVMRNLYNTRDATINY